MRSTGPIAVPTVELGQTSGPVSTAFQRGWLVNPQVVESPCGHARTDLADIHVRVSALGCQLWPTDSLAEGAICAAGRSLPRMSLAFALIAAINGSTGSCATLSHGL
jgi:hypothetical protein